MSRRLIETWLPIAEIGIESLRERTPMTPYPAPNRLHVWWARRPLVASRAAVLASLLPADADRDRFMHALGIHGDPVAGRKAIDQAVRTGIRVKDPYGYSRAFGYTPSASDRSWIESEISRLGLGNPNVLDPTAGGGSIPLEAVRLGLSTFANDLNPVAALLLRATVEWPTHFGYALLDEFDSLARAWRSIVEGRVKDLFPDSPERDAVDTTYLWARTIGCPYCDGLIPLSPNWRLSPDGTGVRLRPNSSSKRCTFEIVNASAEQSEGTVSGGDARCPYTDCRRIVDGDEVKGQAQAGRMGEQLYAVVFKRKIVVKTKAGKQRIRWERGYRTPQPEDDNSDFVRQRLEDKLSQWEADGTVPYEGIAEPANYDRGHRMYGMTRWRDLFSGRQLYCHGVAVASFQELVNDARTTDPVRMAALATLAIVVDRSIDWNSRQCTWELTKLRMAHTFHVHGFALTLLCQVQRA